MSTDELNDHFVRAGGVTDLAVAQRDLLFFHAKALTTAMEGSENMLSDKVRHVLGQMRDAIDRIEKHFEGTEEDAERVLKMVEDDEIVERLKTRWRRTD
jgi:hypothetical protein